MSNRSWLMLIYKVPAEPGRNRLSVWRKIKALGAVYLQNGVCVLPAADDHARRLKILQNDIAEMGGETFLLDCVGFDQAQIDRIVGRFSSERNEAYAEFIERCDGFEDEIRRESEAGKYTYAELEENDEDLKKLRSWLEKIRTIDFYEASRAREAAERLARCSELLDRFADQVFEAQDENRSDVAAADIAMPPGKDEDDDSD